MTAHNNLFAHEIKQQRKKTENFLIIVTVNQSTYGWNLIKCEIKAQEKKNYFFYRWKIKFNWFNCWFIHYCSPLHSYRPNEFCVPHLSAKFQLFQMSLEKLIRAREKKNRNISQVSKNLNLLTKRPASNKKKMQNYYFCVWFLFIYSINKFLFQSWN